MVEVTLKRGDTLVWECEYIDDAGVPVDLTTYDIACQARDSSGNILFDVTSNDSIDIYNPTSGYFLLVPKSDVKFLDMTVETGMKIIVSSGTIVPKLNYK